MLSSVRVRLTLWYVAVLGIVLVIFSAGAYLLMARNLRDRLDARLVATLEVVAAALSRDGPQAIRTREDLSFPAQTIALLDASGKVIVQQTGAGGPPLRLPQNLARSRNTSFFELDESREDADDSCRGILRPVGADARPASYLLVTQSLQPIDEQLDSFLNVLYLIVPLALLLAATGGWFLARRSLGPMTTMSERAQRITAESLDERLPVRNPHDELGRLAASFNELLARLSRSFNDQREFMADASHELRTPLSAIRTTSSVTLSRSEREVHEYREALTIIEQQARRLARIVEDMFLLARADTGHKTLRSCDFYLDELLAETVRAAAMLASAKDVNVKVSGAVESPFIGDEDLLRQMTWNLLENAIEHTPCRGTVQLALEQTDGFYVITVADTGNGIPPQDQPHIFERFYRGPQARTDGNDIVGGGAGLGLPIARWIAEAHRGRLDLQRSDAAGTTFSVSLPRN